MLLSLINVCCKALRPRSPKAVTRRHCLTFSLNGIRFGIDTRVVNKIARYQILAEPRGLPRAICGLFRHQGVMIPVIDIARRYGNHPLRPGGRTCIVLVTLGVGKWKRDVGIMVDEIFGVSEFESSDLRPIPEVAHQMISVEIIEGLVKLEKDYLIVIDAWRLLPDAEMEELVAYMRATFP
jgi:purine-binding chemotaxis protein CheW